MQLSDIKRRYGSWYQENGLDPKLKDIGKLVEFLEKPENLGPKPGRTTVTRKDQFGKKIVSELGVRERLNISGWRSWRFV